MLHFHLVLLFYKIFIRKLLYYVDYTGLLSFSLIQSLLNILGVLI